MNSGFRAVMRVLPCAGLLIGASAGFGSPVAQAAGQTWTFSYVGPQVQHFTVPSGVTQLSAVVTGAPGGQTTNQTGTPGGGGITIATLSVTPGQQFTIWVGGNGNGGNNQGGGGWGFGCGGQSGTGVAANRSGGGGGGGSAVVLGNFTANDCSSVPSVNSPLVVIAGGGAGGAGFGLVGINNSRVDGGAGGAGGNPGVTGSVAPGFNGGISGCGGGGAGGLCQQASTNQTGNNGTSAPPGNGGGGGGGLVGGGGGGFGIGLPGEGGQSGGGGGGGGQSFVTSSSAVKWVTTLSGGPGAPLANGVAPGLNGSVVLTTNYVLGYSTQSTEYNVTIPVGTTQLAVHAEGASGGTRSQTAPVNSAAGGPGASGDATFPVAAGQSYVVIPGFYGAQKGGRGAGFGGEQGNVGGNANGFDGGGGGGGSAVFTQNPNPPSALLGLFVGGGGGGGGDGLFFLGGAGGTGCSGNGSDGVNGGGFGGAGGAAPGADGTHGGGTLDFTPGGAGGGGGGWQGGKGGEGGAGAPFRDRGFGGGGGGAGECITLGPVVDVNLATGSVAGDGYVILTFLPDLAATPVVTAPTSLEGKAQHVGVGTDKGTVRIRGEFTMSSGLQLDRHLDQSTFTLTSLLAQTGGSGELSRHANNARHLPMTLKPRAGSKPTDAVYETPRGAKPMVKIEIHGGARTRVLDYSILVDDALISTPAQCRKKSSAALETSFDIHNGAQLLRVSKRVPWQCHGTEMKTQ